MSNDISFNVIIGTSGDIQVIQYMDKNVVGSHDDVFFTRGSDAQSNIQLITLDDNDSIF
jgi:hypothetical protein